MSSRDERGQGGHKSGEEEGKGKIHQTFEKVKKSDRIEEVINYAKANNRDTAAFIAMVIGTFIIYFTPFYGGTIVGIVTGLYFTKEILSPLRNLECSIEELGMVQSLLFGLLLLALFISAPMIFIAALATVLIKQLIVPEKRVKSEKE